MPNALALYGFPDNYETIVSSSASVKYVSTTGSDSNNGNSITTAYKTIAYAISANSATSTSITIVVLAGTYVETPITAGSSYATAILTDGNKPRVFVCAPGQVRIQSTNASAWGPYIANFQNSGSAVYGAIFERDNGARTTNYMVALFCGSATVGNLEGNFYNCGFTETNANGYWALLYDNESSITSQVNNCTFKFTSAPLADYNGGGGMTLTSCVFSTVNPGGSSTKVTTSYSQSVSATYVTTGVTTQGVYSGTYAWNGTTTLPAYATISSTTGSPNITTGSIGDNYYTIYKFTSSGSIVVASSGIVDFLLVGGGGGGSTIGTGGWSGTGGGGGGGVVYAPYANITASTYTITVGAGGTNTGVNAANPSVNNGGDTTAFNFTAKGGGGGGDYTAGADGGSGGGGSYSGLAGGTSTQSSFAGATTSGTIGGTAVSGVGGGGGGGGVGTEWSNNSGGGGGGGGGVVTGQFRLTSGITYTVTVGAGGTPSTAIGSGSGSSVSVGTNGIDSTITGADITTVTALGGGLGGYYTPNSGRTSGSNGGSGGGSASGGSGQPNFGGKGTGNSNGTRQGKDGGRNFANDTSGTAGGGGGGGTPGLDGISAVPGNGGTGMINIFTGSTTGVNNGSGVYYLAGGGAGAGGTVTALGYGGLGGGANSRFQSNGYSGTTNTGGGGGGLGKGLNGQIGGTGGSGVVIIRYPITFANATTTGTVAYESDSIYRYFTFNSTGTISITYS